MTRRLDTKAGKHLVLLCMHWRVAEESVQNPQLQFGKFSSLVTSMQNLTDKTAAVTSNLGIDTAFKGETRAFL